MKIGVIADDFTGASDIGLTLAEAGMRVAQFIGVPDGSLDADLYADLDAGVVALKSRTAPVAEAIADSLAACDWLLGQGATQIVFKVCSTFDSTAEGNIGPVLDALTTRLGVDRALVCPAFPENGRSVYQGHLFVADGLLNESGMENHPLTPMCDADLRRVLGAQTSQAIAHLPYATVAQGANATRAALSDQGYIIADAILDADLITLGAASKDLPLICGGSGIALGLPANFGLSAAAPDWQAVTGPGVVLSGSCSRATRGQVALHLETNPGYEITAEAAVAGDITAEMLVDWAKAQTGAPLIYSSADPEVVRAAQDRFGRDTAAHAIEGLMSDTAAALAAAGFKRIIVAGGETSGAAVNGLQADQLAIGPRIAAGVPMVRPLGRDYALALKSGNFGAPDFFQTALNLMEKAT